MMNRKIFKLAVPNIVSNITIPLLGLVDTALMGHLDQPSYLGAIALGSMIFNIIYWSLGFLRMGTVGFTAQAYGANDSELQNLIFRRGFAVSIILGIIVLAIHPLLISLGINLTESSAEVKLFAAEYVSIRIWAAPASLLLMVFSGWFLGMQNAIFPMVIAIMGNVLNIIISYILVYHFEMNSAGAAYGTVAAQYISLIIAIGLYRHKYAHLNKKIVLTKILKIKEMTEFFRVNSDIFLRTLVILFVISFFTIQSANMSDNVLAINTILFQFFLFFSFMLDGFANAAEALTGEYLGAKNQKLLKESIRKSLYFGFLFSIIFSLIYYFLGEEIFGLLTTNSDIIRESKPMMKWVIAMPILSFSAFVFDGVYIGATATKALKYAMFASLFIVFIPIYYLSNLEELSRLWIAFLAFMAARGLSLGILLNRAIYGQILEKNPKQHYTSKN